MTLWVGPGRLLKQLVRLLAMTPSASVCTQESLSPVPARFLNRGLGSPIETMVERFLCILLLARPVLPLPSRPRPCVQLPTMWASVAWKFLRRTLFLGAQTLPVNDTMPLLQLSPYRREILILFTPVIGVLGLDPFLTQTGLPKVLGMLPFLPRNPMKLMTLFLQ